MPAESVLNSASFSSLGVTPEDALYALFDRNTNELALDGKQLFSDRKLIASSYEFYSAMLDETAETAPLIFNYKTPIQIAALERDLLFALFIMSAQYKLAADFALDAAESRRENLKAYDAKIKQCATLIGQLKPFLKPFENTPEMAHLAAVEERGDTGHLAYMATSIIPELIARGIAAIATGNPDAVEQWKSEGVTVQAKDSRNAINAPRLYWVWANGWIQTWISLLSDNFTRRQQALDAISTIAPITGFLSFGLYLTNATIEMLMVAKHTIRSRWWMSDAEYELNATFGERFKAHADLRKYSILNDFIWGLGNLACFFWLVGPGTLGYYGNVATTGLLLMDVVLSGFVYLEEKKQYQADLTRYDIDIGKLTNKIEVTEGSEKAILREQLKTLKKARDRCEFEWTHKTYRLVKDWTYAIALVLAFVTMCCLLLPPTVALAPAVSLLLSAGGTALCFISSLINDAMGGYLDIVKSEALAKKVKTEIEQVDIEPGLLRRFEREQDPNVRRLLYLEMVQLRTEFDYQKAMVEFQKMQLVHSVFIRLFVPPLVVASFLFFPLSIGLPVLAAGFALAHQSHRLYMGVKPEKGVLPSELDEEAFKAFEAKVERTIDSVPSFFPKKTKSSQPDGEPSENLKGLPAPSK